MAKPWIDEKFDGCKSLFLYFQRYERHGEYEEEDEEYQSFHHPGMGEGGPGMSSMSGHDHRDPRFHVWK